ncbi:hypothetical protein DPMN_073968 [Dreissena polymorpha]|uniref:Uncharacterized protein n=1 Tax=Dreissena polymorpha TaxID=45954 RepID=A0A9D3YE35_DREPO|nr:hypothetical protein DPMN_073968 [Dreissena polymorpha]
MPTGRPNIVKPNYENIEFDKVLKQIRELQVLFKNQLAVEIWDSFVFRIKQNEEQRNPIWILDTLPRQTANQNKCSCCNSEQRLPEEIERLLEKDARDPKFKLVKKRKQPLEERSTKSQQSILNKDKRKGGKKRLTELTSRQPVVYFFYKL